MLEQSESVISGASFGLCFWCLRPPATTFDARRSQRSRQQAHTGELSRQERVQDKHHRLRTRVEVEHLEEEGSRKDWLKNPQPQLMS